MNPRLPIVVPLLVLLAACSSSSKGSAAPPPTVVPSSAPPSPVEAASAVASPLPVPSSAAPSPSSSPAVPRCHTSQLKATVNDGQGAAGTIFTNVLLLNTSSTTCSLFGYPGLGLEDAKGKDLPSTVSRGGGMLPATTPKAVLLSPAVSASFTFTYSDNPKGSDTESACPPASTLIVTPPDERDPLTTPFSGGPCEGDIDVSPVVAGTHGVSG